MVIFFFTASLTKNVSLVLIFGFLRAIKAKDDIQTIRRRSISINYSCTREEFFAFWARENWGERKQVPLFRRKKNNETMILFALIGYETIITDSFLRTSNAGSI